MDWQPLINLQLELPLNHQVSHLIKVIGIHGDPEVGSSWIVRGVSKVKRCLRVALSNQPLELIEGAPHSWVLDLFSTHGV
jgi:hypothetical protein